jgi:ligand-binding SRPBCC domain-containing protein
MANYQIETELWLPRAREQIFGFFSDPGNLERITPPWLAFEILTPKSVKMAQGTVLNYRLRLRGIPLRWQSVITLWEPPFRFVDEQTNGPYSLWIHEHSFMEHAGGTVVADKVLYAVPGGRIVNRLLVAPDLRRIFRYRQEILHKLFNPQGKHPTEMTGLGQR